MLNRNRVVELVRETGRLATDPWHCKLAFLFDKIHMYELLQQGRGGSAHDVREFGRRFSIAEAAAETEHSIW